MSAWKLGRYYRTYPAYVEDEVRAAPDDGPASTVTDGRYVSARWPGDAYLFTKRFLEVAA